MAHEPDGDGRKPNVPSQVLLLSSPGQKSVGRETLPGLHLCSWLLPRQSEYLSESHVTRLLGWGWGETPLSSLHNEICIKKKKNPTQ